MKELTGDTLKFIAGGCGEEGLSTNEVNDVCQAIFMLSIAETGTKLPPFLGLILMSQHCTLDEVKILLTEYEATQNALVPA